MSAREMHRVDGEDRADDHLLSIRMSFPHRAVSHAGARKTQSSRNAQPRT
jgi:hypothetical protein